MVMKKSAGKKTAGKAAKRGKVSEVMKEFKSGKLKSGAGAHGKVKSRKQAIAIAMHESGQSKKSATKKSRSKK